MKGHGSFSEIRTQYKELSTTNVVEEILSMEEVTKSLLMKFCDANRNMKDPKPQRIIFYRYDLIHNVLEHI